MKPLRNAAVVFIVTVLTLSVSAFASEKTSTVQPVLRMASADQPAETDHAKATLHEAGSADATHACTLYYGIGAQWEDPVTISEVTALTGISYSKVDIIYRFI